MYCMYNCIAHSVLLSKEVKEPVPPVVYRKIGCYANTFIVAAFSGLDGYYSNTQGRYEGCKLLQGYAPFYLSCKGQQVVKLNFICKKQNKKKNRKQKPKPQLKQILHTN